MSFKKELYEYAEMELNELTDLCENIDKHYYIGKKFNKEKNKWRTFTKPDESLTKASKNILKNLFLQYVNEIKETKSWFVNSPRENAKKHISKNYNHIINLDITNYYPSTRIVDIAYALCVDLKIDVDSVFKLLKILVPTGDALSLGIPTSTAVALITHKKLFEEIDELAKKNNLFFTAYADDLTFSSKKPIPTSLCKKVSKILAKHNLKINPKKVRRFTRKSAWVNGIEVSKGKNMNCHWKYDKEIVEQLEKLQELGIHELEVLLGKIAYVQSIVPKRYKVSKKQVAERLKYLKELEKEKNNEVQKVDMQTKTNNMDWYIPKQIFR